MLPRVKIYFESGALGSVIPSPDGVLGIVCSGAAVSGKFALATEYVIRKFEDLNDTLGITEANNANIVKLFNDFYSIAPAGTEVWLMAFANTVTMTDMLDKTQSYAKLLLQRANGRIRGIICSRTPGSGYTPTITNALDDDCNTALIKAQALGVYAEETLKAPIFVLIEGKSYSGVVASLNDNTSAAYNRANIFIGNNTNDATSSCIGVLAGRIASIPVQRNVGRVKDGPCISDQAYIGSAKVEASDPESVHDKGYITLRNYVGRAGYFFTDDVLATAVSDDYRSITARRTIDKAYRIGYDTLLSELLDEIPVNDDGTMQPAMAKIWEGKVENAIALQMTANRELSADVTNPKDRGVQCFIDTTQNVVSTSRVVARVRVKPFGYSRYVDCYIGFKTVVS